MEKYWNGTSSIEEEQLLKKACNTNPEIFSIEEQNLFAGMSAVNSLELPSNFTTDYLDNLEYHEAHERYAVSPEESDTKIRKITWRKSLTRIAAAIILLVGLGVGYQEVFSNKMTVAGLSPTERAAFEESQKALVLIAQIRPYTYGILVMALLRI